MTIIELSLLDTITGGASKRTTKLLGNISTGAAAEACGALDRDASALFANKASGLGAAMRRQANDCWADLRGSVKSQASQ